MILISDGSTQYFVYGAMLGNTTRSNTLTSYPTVEGTSFSDHYYREPEAVNFVMQSSEISKSLVYSVVTDDAGGRVESYLTTDEIVNLLERWFRNATRLEISSIRHYFPNMVLQSYSWSDGDLKIFNPTLNFVEARVQTLRTGVVENPDQYYQAAYGTTVSAGGATPVESSVNIGSSIVSGGVGAAAGAAIGSMIAPGVGTAVGAVIGGVVGFFGSLFG